MNETKEENEEEVPQRRSVWVRYTSTWGTKEHLGLMDQKMTSSLFSPSSAAAAAAAGCWLTGIIRTVRFRLHNPFYFFIIFFFFFCAGNESRFIIVPSLCKARERYDGEHQTRQTQLGRDNERQAAGRSISLSLPTMINRQQTKASRPEFHNSCYLKKNEKSISQIIKRRLTTLGGS